MGLNLNKTWWGYGIKYGGILGIGAETMEGFIYNAKSVSWNEKFSMTSFRAGFGVGGGIGAVGVFVFNAPSLAAIDKTEVVDWGVSISVGPDSSALFESIAKTGLNPSRLESIRNGLHYLYNAFEIMTMGDAPQIVALDLPGGWAYEVSISCSEGTFNIDWGVAE
jgi:hypothetical protein